MGLASSLINERIEDQLFECKYKLRDFEKLLGKIEERDLVIENKLKKAIKEKASKSIINQHAIRMKSNETIKNRLTMGISNIMRIQTRLLEIQVQMEERDARDEMKRTMKLYNYFYSPESQKKILAELDANETQIAESETYMTQYDEKSIGNMDGASVDDIINRYTDIEELENPLPPSIHYTTLPEITDAITETN